MDVELFKKVLPHQCLGSVWSQRAKPGKEHVASTVRATVRQFCHVTACVIINCLGDPSMMARDRAKVVEHWMKVAKVCEGRPSSVPMRSLEKCLCCLVSSQD
ncbi:ral-GDS-related protein-like [Myotis lucifugus]|uniref:ral-GDS-related protein-like n=1 Tax=Myotis lucifugus TaxID=59463 RepID=UPI000CCC9231|nr:ral-GDS-related protein-like [Myotis lucifugus]